MSFWIKSLAKILTFEIWKYILIYMYLNSGIDYESRLFKKKLAIVVACFMKFTLLLVEKYMLN